MKIFLFAKRNIKEILRDPIHLFFSLGFPLVLLSTLPFHQKRKTPCFKSQISHREWPCSVVCLWRYLRVCC